MASARASAMRWRCPPESCAGIPMAERLELDELQQLVDAVADLRLRPLAHLEPERDVVADGHVLERGVVLEHEADVSLLRGQRRCRPHRRDDDLAASGVSSPAMIRSRVDLPDCRSARAAPSASPLATSSETSSSAVNVAEALRDVADEDRHQRLLSFGWRKIIAIRMMTAVAASTKEMPYAGGVVAVANW